MVTTFVRSAGNRTKELWRFIEEASRADIRPTELEHPLMKNVIFLFGQGPDLCSSLFL